MIIRILPQYLNKEPLCMCKQFKMDYNLRFSWYLRKIVKCWQIRRTDKQTDINTILYGQLLIQYSASTTEKSVQSQVFCSQHVWLFSINKLFIYLVLYNSQYLNFVTHFPPIWYSHLNPPSNTVVKQKAKFPSLVHMYSMFTYWQIIWQSFL